MRPDLKIYSALLVVGLGIAYWASLPAKEGDADSEQVFSIDPKSVAEVHLTTQGTDGDTDAVATRRDDEHYWITHTRTEPQKADKKPVDVAAALNGTGTGTGAQAAAATPSPTTLAPKVTTERFLGNDKMDELLKGFSPLTASRVIGKVDAKDLEEFGLTGKKTKFTLKSDTGKTLTLYLGKKSYGSRNRFALEEDASGAPGRVLLIDDAPFDNLEKATQRMYDRRLVAFEPDEVTRAEIKAGTRLKKIAHTSRDKNGQLVWAEDEENAPPKPQLESFMDKVGKVRLASYANDVDAAAAKAAAPFLEITYFKGDKRLDSVVFKKAAGDKPTYWVTSDHLKSDAKLVETRAEPIAKDVDAVLSDLKGDAKSDPKADPKG